MTQRSTGCYSERARPTHRLPDEYVGDFETVAISEQLRHGGASGSAPGVIPLGPAAPRARLGYGCSQICPTVLRETDRVSTRPDQRLLVLDQRDNQRDSGDQYTCDGPAQGRAVGRTRTRVSAND
jgi:hypothetical protein